MSVLFRAPRFRNFERRLADQSQNFLSIMLFGYCRNNFANLQLQINARF